MSVKREYKDSVFTKLFSNPAELLGLYNAVTGGGLPPDTPVEITTLTDVLFTNRRNDIAFIIGGRLVILLEHQSSINENMPLRLLIYIGRMYEKLIDNEAIYQRKRIKFPKPDFIVLYNGTEPFPDEKTLRLSDAYMEMPEAAGLGGALELEVRVLNINEGRSAAILKNNKTLNDYAVFIAKTRAYIKLGLTLTEAVTRAINECIKEGILVKFLREHTSEVVNMLTLEYDAEVEKRVIREEAREEGREEGQQEGWQLGKKIAAALTKGEPPEEIAKTLQIPIQQVIEWKDLLTV